MARASIIVVPLLLALLASSLAQQQQPQRRVRVRARLLQPAAQPAEQPEAEARSAEAPVQVQYYAVAPEEQEEPQALVVVQPRARQQQQYGNQLSRADETEYRQPARPLSRAIAPQHPRTKEHAREPPVQTLRNYNTINDDGSFTFGYEAADGSFKEETRGVDCVVRGKYGYIDPDGNKREFTYVSGNPCDPNNPDPDEDERELEDDSEENVPVRPAVRRPVTPRPRPTPQPSQAVFQNDYQHGQRIAQHPKPVNEQVPITPRPVNHLRHSRPVTAPEATTYRPVIQNYPAVQTERTVPRAQQVFQTSYTPAPVTRPVHPTPPSAINFDEELKRFQIEAGTPTLRTLTPTPTPKSLPATQNIIPTTQFVPRPTPPAVRAGPQQSPRPAGPPTSINPYYTSQLVFDPTSGQYNTVLYQNLPKGGGDFSLNHRLQPYVAQPQPQHQTHLRQAPQQLQYVQPQPFQPAPAPTPATSNVGPAQFRAPTATPANTAPFSPQPFSRPAPSPNAQSFYYINPNLRNQFSTGQIDAFLRGHNIQF